MYENPEDLPSQRHTDIGSARYRGDTWDTRDSNNDKRGMGSAGHYISRQHRPAPRHDAVGDFSSRLSADPTVDCFKRCSPPLRPEED